MNLKRRYIIVFSILGSFVLYLLVHYIVLMVKGDPPNPPRQLTALPDRGPILDRNGRYLALQIRFADVSVWRPSITNLDLLVNELEFYLEIPAAEIRERINTSESNFIYLKRQIDMLPQEVFLPCWKKKK